VPFHSLFGYWRVNIVEGQILLLDVKPWHFLVTRFVAATGAGVLLLATGAFASRRLLLVTALVGGLILVVHSAMPHKEFRYALVPILLVFCCAGSGIATIAEWCDRRGWHRLTGLLPLALILAWAGAGAFKAPRLTFADLGSLSGLAEQSANPWRYGRDVSRALARVGTRPDLCALELLPYGRHAGMARLVLTGGYTYLHRGVPIALGPPTPELRPLFNYAVACPDASGDRLPLPAFDEVDRVGGCVIARRQGSTVCSAERLAPLAPLWRWERPPTATGD
jgi:hypothetical protein